MTLKVSKYKGRVMSLAERLPETLDAEWLVAVYLSLSTAEELGYSVDSNARKSRNVRDEVNTLKC
jgi:hypothetical protein